MGVVRVRGGRGGQVRVLQLGPSDGATDEAEAATDRPCGHGRGGVDCAHAGGGGAVGLVLTCNLIQFSDTNLSHGSAPLRNAYQVVDSESDPRADRRSRPDLAPVTGP